MSVVLGISIANLERFDWVLGQELMRYSLPKFAHALRSRKSAHCPCLFAASLRHLLDFVGVWHRLLRELDEDEHGCPVYGPPPTTDDEGHFARFGDGTLHFPVRTSTRSSDWILISVDKLTNSAKFTPVFSSQSCDNSNG